MYLNLRHITLLTHLQYNVHNLDDTDGLDDGNVSPYPHPSRKLGCREAVGAVTRSTQANVNSIYHVKVPNMRPTCVPLSCLYILLESFSASNVVPVLFVMAGIAFLYLDVI